MKTEELRQKLVPEKIREIEYSYFLNQRELGKMLIVASTTLLIFSVFGLTQLNEVDSQAQTLQEDFEQLSLVVQTDRFNNTVQILEDLETSNIGGDVDYLVQSLRAAADRTDNFQQINSQVEQLKTTYQWLVLISLVGITSGVAMIYV